MFSEHNTPAPTYPQKCYQIKNITYLPHYAMPSRYVAPGMKLNHLDLNETINATFSEQELKDAGAQVIYLPLWHRPSIDLKGI
jgi:hypothetical protein